MTEIKTQFDPILRKTLSKKKQIAIIPVGSIEQHGPHLPISTDSDIVTEVAKKNIREIRISFTSYTKAMVYHLSMLHFLI